MQSEFQLVLVVFAFVAGLASIAYWRQAVIAAMLLLVVEGALRKWVLPGSQAAIYLAKDLLLLGAYIGFAMAKGVAAPVARARPYLILLGMAAVYGAMEMLNPALPTPLLAAVGWRAYFFYIPLLIVVPHLYGSIEDLYRDLHRYVIFALPVAILGLVQFYSSMDSVLNVEVDYGVGDTPTVQGFGEDNRARVAGSFSFVSGFGAYLMAVSLLVGALLAGREWRFRGNATLYLGLILIVAAMFATGSRGPVYSLIGAAALYAVFAAVAGDLPIGAAVRACLGATLLAAAVSIFLPEPAEAFRQRAMGTDDSMERILYSLTEPFVILQEAGIAGFGIGAAHQSAGFLVGSDYPWWTKGMMAEAETSKVMLELGILGFILVFLFRIAIAFAALRAAFVLKTRSGRSLALVLALFLGLQIFGSVIFNPTMNVLYWFAVGMLFALYRFEERDAVLAREQQVTPGLRIPDGAGDGRIRNA
jgi:hypothetical protein